MPYIDGYLIPVPKDKREEYREIAAWASKIFIEHGALEIMENWGDDVPQGKQTDFYRAVDAKQDETVVFSWIIWPDKAARNAGNKAAMEDPRFKDIDMMAILDGKRMIFGGFENIVSEKKGK